MTQSTTQEPWLRFLLIAATVVIVIAGVKAAQVILVPLLLAVFAGVILRPALDTMKRKGIPMPVALLIIFLLLLVVGLIIGAIVAHAINSFLAQKDHYQTLLTERTQEVVSFLATKGIKVPEESGELFNPAKLMPILQTVLGGIGTLMGNLFLVLFILLFLVIDAADLPAKARLMPHFTPEMEQRIKRIGTEARQYMIIQFYVSLATGVAVGIWLAILGVDYAVLWGLLTFLLNFIPNIGQALAALPPVGLALIQLGIGHALLAGAGFAVVNIVLGSYLQPKWMGKGIGLSVTVVFVSMLFWGWVLGPVGIFLSVPLTTIIKIALESSQKTVDFAILLGGKPEDETRKDA